MRDASRSDEEETSGVGRSSPAGDLRSSPDDRLLRGRRAGYELCRHRKRRAIRKGTLVRSRDYQQPRPSFMLYSFMLYSPKCVEGEFCKVRQNPAPTSMSVERAQIGFLGRIILSSS